MRHRLAKTIALLVLTAGASLSAALLGVTPGLPTTTFANPGTLAYSAATGAFSISTTPTAMRFDATPTPVIRIFGTSVTRDLTINILLNPDGTVAGGPAGADLVLRGRITGPDGTVYDGTTLASPLLTGEVVKFGYSNGAIDLYDFVFTPTGGLLLPFYAGKDIAVTVQSDVQNTFAGVFTTNFGGNAKGSLGPVPQEIPQCKGTVGDFVWHDENRNGIQDPNEHGINGVTVTLTPTSPAGAPQTTVTGLSPTGQAGYYQFRDLCQGTYQVTATTPTGYSETVSLVPPPDRDSNGSPTTVTLPNRDSSDQTIDFGFITPCTGTIGDYVWTDLNDNGIQEPGETGQNGVLVQLLDAGGNVLASTTTANSPNTGQPGYYLFDGLCAGAYQVKFFKPDAFERFANQDQGADDAVDSDADVTTGVVVVILPDDDSVDLTIDAGLVPPPPCTAKIGDYVWNDVNGNGIQEAGEQGINGLLVELKDGTGTVIQSTTTMTFNGQPGYYQFTGLPCEGSYQVWVTRPAAYSRFSPAFQGANVTVDSNGLPTQNGTFSVATVSLDATHTDNQTIDFGFYACRGVIGDFVWNDLNGNGIQDAGEPGIPNVTLLLQNGAGESLGITAQTDASGYYQFTGLCAGDYKVVVLSGVPAGFIASPNFAGGDTTRDSNGSPASTTLSSDFVSDLTLDFGFWMPASIGDLVWHDINANGVQDAGEPGIADVAVTLFKCDGTAAGSMMTDADGKYLFSNLVPGCYYVAFGAPADYLPTSADQGGDDALDSDANGGVTGHYTLAPGDANLTVDAGFFKPAALGDYVWNDLNDNGQQDASEPAIAGVTVTLFRCSSSTPVATTTTNAAGAYLFTNLTPGCYYVRFDTPAGFVAAPGNQGADTSDSDAVGGVTGNYVLNSGDIDLTVDAGFLKLAGLGDYVWHDLNANGIQEAGEPGIAGVLVTLLRCDGTPTGQTRTTNATGFYLFSDLAPGCYKVQFATPAGYTATLSNVGSDAADSDAVGGLTGNYTLAAGDGNLTVDAGFYKLAKLGDFVWRDYNQNGQQDAGEPGIAGVLVTLLRCDGTPTGQTQTTNASGLYLFQNLVPGCYKVQFGNPAGMTPSPANIGGDATDSDAVGGLTGNYTLNSGDANLTVDAGFFVPPPPVCIPATFDFTKYGNSSLKGTAGNIRTFTVNGISVKVSAFSESKTTGSFATAYLGMYSYGLGVTDSSEDGNNNTHLLDNTGRNNYVVFEFDSAVVIDKAVLGYVVGDSDAKVWIGNVPNVYNNHLALNATILSSLAFTEVNTGGSSARTADINAAGLFGNVLVVAAKPDETGDGFKLAQVIAGCPTAVCDATGTFAFTGGNSAVTGSAGNVRTFSMNGVNVKASAFSKTDSTGAWAAAYLGAYGPGLGVTDGSENGANDTHKVDNMGGRNNYVLFEFSKPVVVNRAFLDAVGADSDISVWIGTKTDPYNNHVTLSDSVLSSLAKEDNTTDSAEARWANLNAGSYSGNVIIISAQVGDTTPEDAFKISKIEVGCVPTVCTTSGTLSFTGDSASSGTAGNIRSFSTGSVNVKASAFSRTDSTGAWATAYLGAYGPGLGVTDGSEGTGANNTHKVDNIGGRNNYVLLEFSQPVIIDKAYLDAIGADSDITVWIGTKNDPYNNHLTLSDSVLSTLTKEENQTDLTAARWADINSGQLSGNVVIISGLAGDTSPEDAFKLSKLAIICK